MMADMKAGELCYDFSMRYIQISSYACSSFAYLKHLSCPIKIEWSNSCVVWVQHCFRYHMDMGMCMWAYSTTSSVAAIRPSRLYVPTSDDLTTVKSASVLLW